MRHYIFVVIFSLLPFLAIFINPLFPHTHDGPVHLARMASYHKALTDGQLPIRWAGDLNYGYGLPLFNFIYQTPYLIAFLFLSIGFGLVASFKITLFLSYLFSGIFMFLFTKEFFNDQRKAFFVTVFYQFSSFRFVELLVRGSFGEVYTYTFLPLVLYGLTKIMQKMSVGSFIITSIATALLILSHNAISLIFFIICFGYAIFFAKGLKHLFISLSALFVGLLISAFYWAPAVLEHKYTYGDLFMKNLFLDHFPPLYQFFLPNFTNDKFLQTEGISVQFGLFHVIAFIFSVIVLIRYKKLDKIIKKLLISSIALFLIALFFMQPLSKFIWENVSLLRQFQFPWRFLAVTTFVTSLLSVSLCYTSFISKKWVYRGILFLVILSTFYYSKPSLGFDRIDEKYYWNFPLNTTYYGETDLIWSEGPAKKYPKQRVEVIGGKGEISNFYKKSQYHTFTLDAKTDVQLVDHTQYYPGWKIFVDSSSVPIEFQDGHWRGEMVFNVPKGVHEVKAVFTENRLRLITDIISITSIILLVLISIVYKLTMQKR